MAHVPSAEKKVIWWFFVAAIFWLTFVVAPHFIGLLMIVASLYYATTTRSLLVLVLSSFNVLLGIAFDYFLRVRPLGFEFYYGNGASVDFLGMVSLISFVAIAAMDTRKNSGVAKGATISVKLPQFSGFIFYPFIAMIVFCAVFIAKNERSLLVSSFDIKDLVKYPFLEYFGLVVVFAIGSAGQNKPKMAIAYASSAMLVAVCLITSYRMVAIVVVLAMVFMRFNGRVFDKRIFVSLWMGAYVLLMSISYLRLGMNEFNAEGLVGYVNGRLDNTFTGVIETALIYTALSATQGYEQNLMHLLGTVAPIPGSLLPESLQYIFYIHEMHPGKVPGGGLLAGFFIYFHFLLVIPVFSFVYVAFKYGNKNEFCGLMYLICFICIARWWLYGPYVFFKFLGVMSVIYLLNYTLLVHEGRAGGKRFARF